MDEAISGFTDGVVWIDREGSIHYADQKFVSLSGYDPEELRSKKIFFLFPNIKKMDLLRYWDAMKKESIKDWQLELLTKKEAYISKEGCGKVIETDHGSFCCIGLKDATPLSAQIKAGDSRPTRSAKWEWDIDQQQFKVESAFYAILECQPAGNIFTIAELISFLKNKLPPPLKEKLLNSINDIPHVMRKIERLYEVEINGKTKKLFFSYEPKRANGQLISFKGIVQELSEEGEPTLSLFDQLCRLSLDQSPTLMLWINPDCTLHYVNETVCEQLGHTKEELLRTKRITEIDAENLQEEWEEFWITLKEKGHIQVETSFQRKDGTVFPVEMYLNYLQVDDHSLICINARDITKQRNEEAKLRATLMDNRNLSRQLAAENLYLKEEISTEYNFENIISKSKAYRTVLRKVEQVAPTDSTVLILGETGTGKELLARAIHNLSKRKNRPLIKVNCAALPKELIESELFGHEKGAFTGAYDRKVGRFELADRGTLFLDEIGELPLDLQVKLLRVLQEGEFERVGGNKTISVDIRVITATNRDLDRMIKEGTFRSDLFYRLNVFPIENMPLRDRKDDIPLLVQHFVEKYSDKIGKKITGVKPEDMEKLMRYEFPGNIRELENILERAVIVCQGSVLHIPDWHANRAAPSREENDIRTFDEMQRDHIIKVLDRTQWKVAGPNGAAELLDLHEQTLYSKMRKLGIRRNQS